MRPTLLLLVLGIRVGLGPASVRAEDSPAPTQELATDPATPYTRFGGSIVARAPFDRSYGVGLGYAPSRWLETDLRLAMREDRGVEIGLGLVLRPMRRTFEGPLLRLSGVAILEERGQASSTGFRADFDAGYTLRVERAFVEATLGASRRNRGPYAGEPAWAFALGFRVGVGC